MVSLPESTVSELDLRADPLELTRALCDLESVSGDERRIADAVEAALSRLPHLEVLREGNAVVARTALGRPERVIIAGHLDTVPVAGNLPCTVVGEGPEAVLYGRGSCDMKGGVAAALLVAAQVTGPTRDVTFVFYDCEEVEEARNGLGRLARQHPDWLVADFAVLAEPTAAGVEGGCQGTMRVEITVPGVAAHSARSWTGHNAIHDAATVLTRLREYRPREVQVDGLTYREGLNAVGIRGGVAGNVIPDRCVVTVNYRYAPDKNPSGALAHLRDTFHGFELVVTDSSPGARPGLDRPAAAEFVTAIGREPTAKLGWTDVARFAELGIPAVNFGPGDPNLAHRDDEHCPAEQIEYCRAALTRWLTA